jgi:hypothetical protein
MKMMMLLGIIFLLTHCTKFDSYDPTTGILKWVITKDKDVTTQ